MMDGRERWVGSDLLPSRALSLPSAFSCHLSGYGPATLQCLEVRSTNFMSFANPTADHYHHSHFLHVLLQPRPRAVCVSQSVKSVVNLRQLISASTPAFKSNHHGWRGKRLAQIDTQNQLVLNGLFCLACRLALMQWQGRCGFESEGHACVFCSALIHLTHLSQFKNVGGFCSRYIIE